ncbi:MAG TPA: APC family permease [Chloroflexota bacterium]|nr:APC family permease [Chloroflexota bacterium]
MPTDASVPAGATMPSRLASGAVGLPAVLFQSITHMAPAAAVAFSITVGVPYAGGSIPLAVLLALIACLFVASSIGQLAQHLPSAGGLYTYNANGLGPIAGFLVAWGFMMSEPIVAPLLYLIFGNLVGGTLTTYFHTPSWLWAVFVVLAGLLVWYLTYAGIKISADTGVLLGLFEIIVFLALAITLVAEAGSRNTLSVFTPHLGNSHGYGSVFAGMIYAILAFIGFEASAPLGEEAKDPKKTIPRAVVLSAVLIGLFYLFSYYAASVYFGPHRMAANFVSFNNGDPWTGMAKKVWGIGWILVFLAVANSAIANSNAGVNAATRVGYAMGRIGLLPRQLARVHPTHRTPYVAINVQAIVGIALALFLGFATGSPLNGFALLGTVATIIVIGIYILTNLSCVVYYWRDQRAHFNILLHFLIPVLGVILFVPALIASFGINFAGLGISPLTSPSNLAPIIIGIWMLIGIGLLVYFMATNPARVRETSEVYLEEPDVVAPPAQA